MRKLFLLSLLLSTIGIASAFSADLDSIQASIDKLYESVRLCYVTLALMYGVMMFYCLRIK